MELWVRLLRRWQARLERLYLASRPKVDMDDIETRMYLLEKRFAAHTPHVMNRHDQ